MLHHKKYVHALKNSAAGACIISPAYVALAPKNMRLLVHENPYKAYALIAQVLYLPSYEKQGFISEKAFISSTAIIGAECIVESGAYIGEQAVIGKGSKIGVNTYIGDGVVIGQECLIENNVSISNAIIGNKTIIYPGARIGQDGFGFASDREGHYKIPHLGRVIIGDDVEIGANTCIDRGSLNDTVIEDQCRIDNLVQIGHNVKVGKGSVLVAQVGVAGSTELGKFVTLAGQVGIIGHLKVGDGATIFAKSLVVKNVEPGAKMAGYPAVPLWSWHRQVAFLKKLLASKK
ncbi:UDP-3-O-(3-hydroxymyristoyl)glucosamine N-acyltransferase [Legionella tunisiensis]|uniref:UDP-3-O-(3-hydroxymyristoyl)glucosamine N-acyltransferase n=1 Tax=Legionella tunisiensis TaxID=1034944 RepID=UPI0002D48716|nr:UDP-3-O-(3-hydroxymyristoyl)glucosamine N-acyltransferase [Legionella tunisiensis]